MIKRERNYCFTGLNAKFSSRDQAQDELLKHITLTNRRIMNFNQALSLAQGMTLGKGLEEHIPEIICGIVGSKTLVKGATGGINSSDSYEENLERLSREGEIIISHTLDYVNRWEAYYLLCEQGPWRNNSK